jgi:hypothetical protein
MVTGTIRLMLDRDSESQDRRAVGGLYALPVGTRVVVLVGARAYAPPWTVDQLRQYVDHVHLDVQGEFPAVQAWVQALRGNDSARLGWPA